MKKSICTLLAVLASLCLFGACTTTPSETPNPDNGTIETPDNGGNEGGDVGGDENQGGNENEGGETEKDEVLVLLESAYGLEKGATLAGTHTLTGVVTNVAKTGEGEACLTIVVKGYDEYPMYCYWLKGEEAGNLVVGDIITVTGTIKNYKGTVEFDKPTLDAFIKGERPALEVTTTPGTGIAEGYNVISIEMAKEICAYVGEATTEERYYIQATIDTVTNAKYGEMYIYDETGSIKVYGTYSEDGSIGYEAMTDKPFKGAEVLLSCTLHSFGETPEVQNARLIAFANSTFDEANYTQMTVEEARAAVDGTNVKVEGVVAQITYATGFVPSGAYIVDGTNSIYVYDRDLAGRVQVGNKITVAGTKTHWILDTETSSAAKFGYAGCNQIEDAWLLENDGLDNAWNKSWVDETTVKAVMDTPVTTDITTTIFKVNAIIKEAQGTGFTNFYINDLDETTGSYVYTQCNGNDFTWLRQYDNGNVYTVYFSVINAKSSGTGCVWRLIPIAVEDNNFVAVKADAPKFFVDYYGIGQFASKYTANPALELTTAVTSRVYGVDGTLSYTSSNTEVATVEGNVLNFVAYGNVTITVTATTADGVYSATVDITYEEPPKFNFVTVAEAIAIAPDTEGVIVKGIVGPSLVNQAGFYLFGEDGSVIAIRVSNKDEAFAGLSIGNEVYVQGMRERFIKDDSYTTHGQTCIVDAVILQNNYGNYEYSTAKFVETTVAEFYALDATVDYSTTVFVVTGTIAFPTGNGQVSINADGASVGFYASGASQYEFLRQFEGQEVTIEVAACNWNAKTYWRGCVLAVRMADGTKILNTLNFNA